MSGGACHVMADFFNSHHHWQRMSSVSSLTSNKLNLFDGPWRGTVLQLLESRDNNEMTPYCDYEQAVDKVGLCGAICLFVRSFVCLFAC